MCVIAPQIRLDSLLMPRIRTVTREALGGRRQRLPYEQLRFITKAPVTDLKDLYLSTDAELLEDYRGRSLLVFASQWSINFILKRNPGLELSETAQ